MAEGRKVKIYRASSEISIAEFLSIEHADPQGLKILNAITPKEKKKETEQKKQDLGPQPADEKEATKNNEIVLAEIQENVKAIDGEGESKTEKNPIRSEEKPQQSTRVNRKKNRRGATKAKDRESVLTETQASERAIDGEGQKESKEETVPKERLKKLEKMWQKIANENGYELCVAEASKKRLGFVFYKIKSNGAISILYTGVLGAKFEESEHGEHIQLYQDMLQKLRLNYTYIEYNNEGWNSLKLYREIFKFHLVGRVNKHTTSTGVLSHRYKLVYANSLREDGLKEDKLEEDKLKEDRSASMSSFSSLSSSTSKHSKSSLSGSPPSLSLDEVSSNTNSEATTALEMNQAILKLAELARVNTSRWYNHKIFQWLRITNKSRKLDSLDNIIEILGQKIDMLKKEKGGVKKDNFEVPKDDSASNISLNKVKSSDGELLDAKTSPKRSELKEEGLRDSTDILYSLIRDAMTIRGENEDKDKETQTKSGTAVIKALNTDDFKECRALLGIESSFKPEAKTNDIYTGVKTTLFGKMDLRARSLSKPLSKDLAKLAKEEKINPYSQGASLKSRSGA